MMAHKISWEEIKSIFPNEWVAIGDLQGDLSQPYGSILGNLLVHESNEKVFTQRLKDLHTHQTIDIRYTGDILPDNPVGPVLWQISDTSS